MLILVEFVLALPPFQEIIPVYYGSSKDESYRDFIVRQIQFSRERNYAYVIKG